METETIDIDEAIAIESAVRERAEKYHRKPTRASGFINWHTDVIYTNGVEECSGSS